MANADIIDRLAQFWVFQGFSADELTRISGFLTEEAAQSGTDLYHQGDPADRFYLLERGEVLERGTDASGALVLRRRTAAGDYFGHRSLMDGGPRRATATVTRGARLLSMTADDFHTMLAMYPALKLALLRIDVANRLLAIPLFASFTEKQLFHMADLARTIEYPAGETIFRQGEPAEAFYVIDVGQVIEQGAASAPGTQSWPKYLAAGNWFGRYALQHRTSRRAAATAVSDVNLYRFDSDAFHWLCQWNPAFEQALKRPDVLRFLRDTGLFSRLSEKELKQLSGYVGLAHFRPGDVLYRQGDTDPTLYVLYEGEAILRVRDLQGNERPVGYLQAGDVAGHSSLFLEEPRDVTVQSTTASNWCYLTREDLDQYLHVVPGVRKKLVVDKGVEERQRISRLPWLDRDEQVILRTRRHWFYLLRKLAIPALILLGSLIFLPFFFPVALSIAIVDGLWLFWRFLDWTNDYYIVTTQRVAHREKVILVRETREETPLDKIQNVNINQAFLGNLLGFGHLVIDTAAVVSATPVSFTYLPQPDQVQALVFDQMKRQMGSKRSETRHSIRRKLEDAVGLTVHPAIPRPVVPPAEDGTMPTEEAKPAKRRLSLLDELFWIERSTDGQTTWRKHWIRLLARVWLPLLALLFLVLFLVVPIVAGGAQLVLVVVPLVLLPPALFWLWWEWRNWGNDLYIVTNDRVIDIDRSPLGFRSQRNETTFDKVQNASYDIPNPIATILNYGTVTIHTAGAQGTLDFFYVRDPKKVQAEVFRRLAAYQEGQKAQLRDEQQADLPEWFAEYDQRRRYNP